LQHGACLMLAVTQRPDGQFELKVSCLS